MKNSILKGITYLTVGSLITKILGGIYKIVLAHILGGGGLGLYYQIFPTYSFFIILVTSGVALGVSKLLVGKEKEDDRKKLFSTTLKIFLVFSLSVAVILLLLSGILMRLQNDNSLKWCYYILAPAIVFSSMSAVFKGWFQSKNDFRPTVVANIVEQIIKMGVALALALIIGKGNLVGQITGCMIGISIGDLFSIIILKSKIKNNKLITNAKIEKKDVKELSRIVLPIMIYSLIIPCSQMLDSVLVVKLLHVNFEPLTASYLYGLQTGIVGALINFPTIIVFAIATVLLPHLSKDYKSNNIDGFIKKISLGSKIIIWLAVPCCLFVLIFPNKIIGLLYSNNLNGFNIDGVMLTSKLLFWSSFNVIFLCLSQFFAICLQSNEHKYLPIVNNAIGMVVKLIFEIAFIPNKSLNILSFTLAGAIGYGVIFILNLLEIIELKWIQIKSRFWIKLFISNVVVILCSMLFVMINGSDLGFLITTMFAIVLYLFITFITKIFSKKEFNALLKDERSL